MAERRVQMRPGRRDRRRDGDGDSTELKRRSRSEGPGARRIAQSMDVGSSNNNNGRRPNSSSSSNNNGNASFERRDGRCGGGGGGGGSMVDRDSPLASDDGGGPVNQDASGSDSDSDSDRMQWTKNPLKVRKVKKNNAEKRNAGGDNGGNSSGYTQLGQRNTNRESWVYLAPEGTPLPTSPEQQKGDNGSGSGSLKNKYQRLEEMRKKRIDMAMTSDEENTPESRISRLRQRALQGALGSPAKTDSSRAIASDHNSWGRSGPRSGSAVMSDQGSRPANAPPVAHYGKQPVAAQPQPYRPAVMVSSQQASRTPQQQAHPAVPPRQTGSAMAPLPVNMQSRVGPGRGQSPQHSVAPVKYAPVRPFTDGASSEMTAVGTAAPRQQFYTIPEPQFGSRAVHNSSPEVNVRRFKPAVRIPSADSIYDGVTNAQDAHESSRPGVPARSVVSGRVYAQVNPPSQDVVEMRRGTALQHQAPAHHRQSGGPKFNEVVELRLRSSRVIDRPLSQTFEDPRIPQSPRRRDESGFRSEDSLDELIESNIQYLEKEFKNTGSKKSQAPVSRSSSLPDPRKSVAVSSKPQVTVSGQHIARPTAQATTAVQNNKSELHFRVPLPPQQTSQSTPRIHIAEENQWTDSAQHPASNSYTFGVVPRVERKHSYDSRLRSSRPNSEVYDREEVSKSDTQLNAAVVPPTYRGAMLHPSYVPGRGYVSDQNLTVDYAQGMFSDVDYDIEVSERVKKWETYMKKPDFVAGGENKKPVPLTPIEERTEGDRDSLMMPSEIRRSVRMGQPPRDVATAASHNPQLNLISMKPANSDPSLHVAGDTRALSNDNLHRFFQVVQDPVTGANLSQSTSAIYIDLPHQGPQLFSQSTTLYQPSGFMSANELRQHMLANQRSRSENARTAAAPPPLALGYDDTAPNAESTDRNQRLSRYQDEIDEMTSVKHQSVSNLRRRFDESKASASEDESRLDSRVAKVSPTQKEGGDVSWSQMITGLEDRIRDMEVWSPNMESTQGNVVSIERVKARTLQTIPFSEDPFWKEIEEMTSFDPNSLGGHLSASEEVIKPSCVQPAENTPHSSTLPCQPRLHSNMSMKERMQRSKSLYTPNITPLTINVEPYSAGKTSSLERGSSADKYSGHSALDEVLEDIRTSLERKPLSPMRKTAVDSSDSLRSSPGPAQSSEIMRARLERDKARAPTAGLTGPWDSLASSQARSRAQPPMSITISSSVKAAPPLAALAPGAGMGVGHYHLDPHLLSQKLLSTGLVEADHKPQPPVRSHMPARSLLAMSKPVAVAPPQTVVRSVVAPTQRPAASLTTGLPPAVQGDKLSQVTNSMEDLRQLAVNVERRINDIKSKLITTDDHNLDKILLSLRKFSPSEGGPLSSKVQGGGTHDFYTSKKSKLEDALRELDRIHVGLDLHSHVSKADPADFLSYRAKPLGTSSSLTSSTAYGSAAVPGRLMSTSAYVAPVSVTSAYSDPSPFDQGQRGFGKADTDKEAQSEFDVISKSFQAIIDEVNKTACLVSSASTPQPRPHQALPEIQELRSRLFGNMKLNNTKPSASPEPARRPLNVTLASQQAASSPGPTPKSPPPIVAPKPALRMQGQAPQCPQSPSQQALSIVTSSIQTPVTSVVQAQMTKPSSDKRDQRTQGRFRPKPANQEKDDAAAKRARSKSSPSITLQDLSNANERMAAATVGDGQQHTAKTQLSFQLEPAGAKSGSRKPPLKLDVAKAQKGSVMELQLKPPAMFQDEADCGEKTSTSGAVVTQSIVIKPLQDSAPPSEGKTVLFPETPITTSATPVSIASSAQQPGPPSRGDLSSSESSAEGKDRKGKKMGRGVAMMVELFSSSDDEKLRKCQPLHTRSAPDLSGDIPSDDSVSVPKSMSNVRPAEITRLMQTKAESTSAQSSPAPERRRAGGSQSDSVGSPQSPSYKPPFHPFRRHQPSPDRSSDSPHRTTALPETQPADTARSGDGNSTNTSSSSGTTSATALTAVTVTPRIRSGPPRGTDDDVPERPRSFHELLSTFEPDQARLSKLRSQGRCASEDALAEQVVVARVFRASPFTSEPDLRSEKFSAPTPQGTVSFQLKIKAKA